MHKNNNDIKHQARAGLPDRDLKSGIQDWLRTLDERHSPACPRERVKIQKQTNLATDQ